MLGACNFFSAQAEGFFWSHFGASVGGFLETGSLSFVELVRKRGRFLHSLGSMEFWASV